MRVGWLLVVGAVLVTAAICIYGLLVSHGRRLFILAATGYSVVLTVVSLFIRGTAEAHMAPDHYTPAGSRYFFVPVLLLAAAFIAIADSATGRRWLRLLPAFLVAGVTLANVSINTARGNAPNWRRSVRAAYSQCHSPREVVHVPIAPLNGDWFVPVPCKRLRG
jgi:hypothetical protein